MIKEVMLAGALLANNSNININDFYRNRVDLATIYYGEEMNRNQPIYFYDPFTNRYAYESGYDIGVTSYPAIEQELNHYGVYETSPISLLNEDFYPYAGSYTYDYYYLDLRFDLRYIIPGSGNWLNADKPLYFVVSTFDISGEFQDSFSIELSPLEFDSYYEYSFNISDYLGYIYYKPELSEAGTEVTDFDTTYRYIGFSLFDSNYNNSYNIDFEIDISLTEWEYRYSENGVNYNGSIDLMEEYINKSIITKSNQYINLNNQYNEILQNYEELEETNTNLEILNQELIKENDSLKANGIVANSFGSIIKIISDNASALLQTEILPNFTIGNIIFIPVIFSLLGIIFKFFRR